jgi:hypothetical protein
MDRMHVLTKYARQHVNSRFMQRALASVGLVPVDASPAREAHEAVSALAGREQNAQLAAPSASAPKFRFARRAVPYPSGEKWPEKYAPPGKPDPGGVQNPGEHSTASGIQGVWKCFDLPKKMCKSCPHPEMNNAGTAGGCDLLQSQCVNLFCDPLCLSLTWECRIEGTGDFAEVKQFPISNALCAQFIAQGCSKILHCCDKKDPLLWNWVENRWYGGKFPFPNVPISGCTHNELDEKTQGALCDGCEAAVKVKLRTTPELCKRLKSSPLGATAPRFDQQNLDPASGSGSDWSPYNKKFGFPGIGMHKSLKERCEELLKKVEEKLGGMQGKFEKRACECLGCCKTKSEDDTCFFPMTEFVNKGDGMD